MSEYENVNFDSIQDDSTSVAAKPESSKGQFTNEVQNFVQKKNIAQGK